MRLYVQAMAVPELAVVTEPDCRRRETVLPDLWSQVRVVDSPAVKEYPPLGLLKSLLVLAAAARAAKSEVTVMKCIMDTVR